MINPDNKITGKSNDGALGVEQLLSILDKIPTFINVLNEAGEVLYCNQSTVDAYGVSSKEEYSDNFFNLTPELQPDGQKSIDGFMLKVRQALVESECHFNWLDIKQTGEELPLHITLYKMNMKDNHGKEMLVSFMRDIKPYLAGYDESDLVEDDYYNQITYRSLFTTVAELVEEWFWVYDNKLATIQFFGKGRSILDLPADRNAFPESVVGRGMVYADDLEAFLNFDNNMKIGIEEPVDVRFIQPNGVTRWYRITYKTTYDTRGKPLFSVGKTYDIDKQKRYEVLSKTDLLTNCYNKITTENSIREILDSSTDTGHAMFIIDVDDFKSVNDNLGHYFGDIVLSDIAKNLHTKFRGADVIGRIGGDEFLVFIRNVADISVLKSKAQAISDVFASSYAGEKRDYKISGSIGVAIYPEHGNTYEELYKAADKALYRSKMRGKDCYTVYSKELAGGIVKSLTAVDNSNRIINTYFDAELVSSIFDLMFDSKDVSAAMHAALRIIGSQMGLDRCYIGQTFDDNLYSITYEWTAPGKEPIKNKLQGIPLTSLQPVFDELNENGIINSNNDNLAEHMQNASDFLNIRKSDAYLLVLTGAKESDRFLLALDVLNEPREWTEKEINSISYIQRMLSIFLSRSSCITPDMAQLRSELTPEEIALIEKLRRKGYVVGKGQNV